MNQYTLLFSSQNGSGILFNGTLLEAILKAKNHSMSFYGIKLPSGKVVLL